MSEKTDIIMAKKIYFAGSIRGGRVDADLYHRIISYIQRTDVVLTEHVGKSNLSLTEQGRERDARINSQRNCSFPQFVNTYRVAHAQLLLQDQSDIKISEVCMASGFSSEASFYRIFKNITGTTPTDWRHDNTTTA